ncbi:MAG: hypothetical protein ACRD9L_28740, partial [Bryobacteraceae bacterium]
MTEREDIHLTAGQILAVGRGEAIGAAAGSHLEFCAGCRDAVEEWRGAREELAPLLAEGSEAAGGCPSMESLANFAAGSAAEGEEIAAHVLGCGRCAGIVRGAHAGAEEEGGATALLASSG